ncbi:MAG: hypothetical protein ACRDRU_03580 [Pseudonocardiaceae bacterium]
MVINEIQRVSELLSAIKEQVDTDPRPGRFLLTGSACRLRAGVSGVWHGGRLLASAIERTCSVMAASS